MPLIQEIFTHYGGLSYKKYQKSMPPLHKKALVAIMNYRTKSLGGEVYYCSKCNEYHYSYSRVLGIKAGIGTVIATMIPYSIVFFIMWTILLVTWILLGLPLGPGADLYYEMPAN